MDGLCFSKSALWDPNCFHFASFQYLLHAHCRCGFCIHMACHPRRGYSLCSVSRTLKDFWRRMRVMLLSLRLRRYASLHFFDELLQGSPCLTFIRHLSNIVLLMSPHLHAFGSLLHGCALGTWTHSQPQNEDINVSCAKIPQLIIHPSPAY